MRIADGSNLICLGFFSEIHDECEAKPVACWQQAIEFRNSRMKS
jgi:hypothetical protein